MGIIKKVTDALGEDGLNLAKVAGQQFLGQNTDTQSAESIPSGPAHSAPPPAPPSGEMVAPLLAYSAPAGPPTAVPTPPVANFTGDVVEGLHKLGEMYKAGLLTEAEFNQAKSRLLA